MINRKDKDFFDGQRKTYLCRKERKLCCKGNPDPIASGGSLEGQLNAQLCEIVKKIDERITIHDLRTIPSVEETKVIFDCVMPSDCGLSEPEIKEEISRLMSVKFPDCRFIIAFDSGFASIPKSTGREE